MMPSAVGEPEPSEEIKWRKLKTYILRERQRHKQEQEADLEVIRQKREREQKHKQDVMTLTEIDDQLKSLNLKLGSLTEAKHQLFLSLKKVLNEDDSRRRQATRELNNESSSAAASYPAMGPGAMYHQAAQRLPMYKMSPAVSSGPHPSAAQGPVPIPVQGASLGPGPSGVKRPHSPSPPPHGYNPYNNYKSPSYVTNSVTVAQHSKTPAQPQTQQQQQPPPQQQQQQQPPPQHPQEDTRRNHEFPRAVLWNKGAAPPYVGVYGGVYGVAPSAPTYSYAGAPPTTYEHVYTSRQAYDGKSDGEKLYLRGPAGPLPMAVHSAQAPKAGLTTAFPVRPTHQHNTYLTPSGSTSARLLYAAGHSTATVQSPAARYQSSGAM